MFAQEVHEIFWGILRLSDVKMNVQGGSNCFLDHGT